jgi:hypothetical protein
MLYFLDSEFIDTRRIELISLGLVSEDNREYYAIDYDSDWTAAHPWVIQNVLTEIPTRPSPALYFQNLDFRNSADYKAGWRYRDLIKGEVAAFIGDDQPEIWGWFNSSDWVAFYQLWGAMIDLPPHFPRYIKDLKQTVDELGNPQIPFPKTGHHALRDAQWLKQAYFWLKENYQHPAFDRQSVSP